MEKTPSQDYITYICKLYNDIYDDRMENTCLPISGNTPCPWQRLSTVSACIALISVSFLAGTAGEWNTPVYIKDQKDSYHRRLLDNSVQQGNPGVVFLLRF